MAKLIVTCFILFVSLNEIWSQKNPYWVSDRNSIVQLFEWKFQDIADECERFLQQNGYAGVQVSPVSENLIAPNRPWWERYQPMSYMIATRSGTAEEFVEMTTRCNSAGIRIYVDAVLNHMTMEWYMPVGTGGSTANPGNKEYPGVPYRPVDFHDTCSIENIEDAVEIRECEFSGRRDLDQSLDYVREKNLEFLNRLIALGVAGFRIDSAKYMSPNDLNYLYLNLINLNTSFGFEENSRPFIYQEVNDLDGGAVSKEEYTPIGVVSEFKFSSNIGNVFRGNAKLSTLKNWGPEWGFLPNSTDALVFIDDHDNQRDENSITLSYKLSKQYKMATAFMLAHPYGITRIMSSFGFENSEQGPPQDFNENIISPGINADETCSNGWICEHRWRQIYNMVKFKNAVAGSEIVNWWSNGDQQIAFCRGNLGFIAFSNSGNLDQNLQTCLPPGMYCDIITGNIEENVCTGKTVTVDSTGMAQIQILENEDDGVLAFHVSSILT